MELLDCHNLAVPKEVMDHVVRVESSYNPYAIGVVGGRLVRQPKSLPEALATVRMLEARGFNFSLGLAQVNRYNLRKYGLHSYETAFKVCPNLQAGSRILAECYSRFRGDWGKSFSCYYSGNPVTGFRHGYVQKVFASMRAAGVRDRDRAANPAIRVSGKSRRLVGLVRYPTVEAQSDPRRTEPDAPALSNSAVAAVAQPAVIPPQESSPPTGVNSSERPARLVRQGPVVDSAFVF